MLSGFLSHQVAQALASTRRTLSWLPPVSSSNVLLLSMLTISSSAGAPEPPVVGVKRSPPMAGEENLGLWTKPQDRKGVTEWLGQHRGRAKEVLITLMKF